MRCKEVVDRVGVKLDKEYYLVETKTFNWLLLSLLKGLYWQKLIY